VDCAEPEQQEHDQGVNALPRNGAALNAILADPAAHLRSREVLLAMKPLDCP